MGKSKNVPPYTVGKSSKTKNVPPYTVGKSSKTKNVPPYTVGKSSKIIALGIHIGPAGGGGAVPEQGIVLSS